ncbi:MAG: hypothetical protein M5R40_07415 [Anaerolineae bacterium]|nr:hypothetical protein [Anaerolineae bacterium]
MVTAFGAWDSDDLVAALRTCYPGTAVDISRCADSVWRADMHLFACRVAVALRDFPGVERVCQLVRPGDTFPRTARWRAPSGWSSATDAGQVNVLVRLHDRCIPARAFGPEDELLLAWQTPPDQVVERWSALVTGTEAAP